MLNEIIPSTYEPIETVSSSSDSDVSIIRQRENGEYFILKSRKDLHGGEKSGIDRKIRFKREMDIVSSLDHPNIAKPVFPLTLENKESIAYPYRKGRTLSAFLDLKANFFPLEALRIMLQLLSALEHIHSRGIIHCDVNPNNLFIDESKGLQLLDFGISLTEDEAAAQPEGRVFGTLPWLSPEQMGFTGFKIDTRSDLYGAALILYRMLAGKMPFTLERDTVAELLNHALHIEVEPLRKVPAVLNAILLKALKPTPGERYQTATGFKHDILAAIEIVKDEKQVTYVPGVKDTCIAVNRARLFIARARETEALKDGLSLLMHGQGISFCIYGKSGIGKTEIVREFRRNSPETGFFYISSKCNSFTPRQPYSLFRHLVLECISRINNGPKTETQAFSGHCQKELADYSGVICKMVPEMRQFFKEVLPVDLVDPEKEADRTAHVLFTLFAALCSFRPLVMIIDDLQWVDRVSFEIVRRLINNNVSCMIVSTFRTERYENDLTIMEFDLRKTGFKKLMPVLTFTRPEIKDLIVSRFGNVADIDVIVDLVVSKTDCSPFAVSEAFRFLVNNSFLTLNSDSRWTIARIRLEGLPDKLDPLELILDKVKGLNPDEMHWLETASLAEGKFSSRLIEDVSGFIAAQSSIILENLENAGFLVPQFGGGYRFAHDRIQDSIRSAVSRDRCLEWYEKFGGVYEAMAESGKEFLFNSAESYLKSRNISKAIELSCKAARHAAESVALDIAARYYTSANLLVSQIANTGMAVPVDVLKMRIEFGDVLMLLGRNEQALKMFKGLVEGECALDTMSQLDIKYKIGSIYHNSGDFDTSITCFFEALGQLGIAFPNKVFTIIVALFSEMLKQFIYSVGIKSIVKKKNDPINVLAVKILNKLSFSLFYKNILQSQFAHFKALNIADLLIDCAEKAEAYSCHIVSSFLLLMKKRAFLYHHNSVKISKKTNRKDVFAFAESFGGVTCFFNAKWKTAKDYSSDSITTYKSIGDLWGQVVPLETLVFIEFKKGNFLSIEPLISRLIRLDEECRDQRGLALVHVLSTYAKYLVGKDSYADWATILEESETILSKVPLVKTICNNFIANKFLICDQIKSGYDLSNVVLESIKKNNLLQEYVASAFSDRCEILIREYRNRHHVHDARQQLSLTDRALLRQLRAFIVKAYLRGIMYPAHLGAAIRAFAWYNAFKKRRRIARFLFKKAVNRHHRLEMRYEQAKSIRDFALFYEMNNEPGMARDLFNKAYERFEKCGTYLECSLIEDKVDKELVKRRKEPESAGETSTGSFETVDQMRVDTIYNASLLLCQSETVEALLRQTVHSLIKATGAQYGLLHLDADEFHEERELALDFEGREQLREELAIAPSILERARRERQIVVGRPAVSEETFDRLPGVEEGGASEGSCLCVPLVRGDKYYGCVYLTNTLVSGLFSESAGKAAQIIAGQASFLIENQYLMEEYKRLNERLEHKVREQTSDIREKHEQLSTSNLKLIESERMKDLLTGTIVHDIKNFAAGISGNIRLLSYKYKEDLRTLRSIDLVVESCTDIVNLSSNLLDMSKMEEGRLTLQQRQLYFEEIAAIAQKYGRNVLFDEKKITVTIMPPKGDFAVMADPYLVERVVQNLYSNAAKYTNAGGSVSLSFEEQGGENVVTFASSGPIIPDDQKAVIFEKYSRVEGKQSQYSKGLGLFFCRMVMTAHQGRIWLDTDESGNYFRLGFRKV
ncbi:MAG: AAA family ATPase [Chitinispirillaceae bacterium]|nr:AAA family ATPase [Chitinispirillaceae bacterium]